MPTRPPVRMIDTELDSYLYALLDGVDSAVVICDRHTIPVYVNDAARRLLGASLDASASLANCLPVAEQSALRQLFKDAAEHDVILRRVFPFQAGDEALQVSVRAIEIAGEQLSLCTLQPQAVGKWPSASPGPDDEAVLARLLDGFPGMAYRGRTGGQWDMILVSKGARDLTGYAPEQLVEGVVNYRDLIHPEDRGRVWQELESALAERRCYQLSYRIRSQTHAERWVWEHGVGIYDSSEPMIEGFIVDITEHKRTEFRIREGQRSLATLVSNLQGMAYRCSHTREWDMYFVSDGCMQLTGYASSELLYSRKIAYGDLVHPADRDKAVAEVERAVAEHRPFRVVYRIITAGGQEKLVWDQGSGVFAEDGSVIELEGFITELDVAVTGAGNAIADS